MAAAILVAAGAYFYFTEVAVECGPMQPGCEGVADPIAPALAQPTGEFDYYVLALSWSPSYCEAEAKERDRLQCGGRPFHFIVHGLWPQLTEGRIEDCPNDAPRVPDRLVDALLDIMPSRGLIGHEWRSHGTCTGLSQEEYFATLRAAFAAVNIPDAYERLDQTLNVAPGEIAAAFIDANGGRLTAGQLVVTCGGGPRLDEVRICMTKDLQFRACGTQMMRGSSCRRETVRMPPVRGGS